VENGVNKNWQLLRSVRVTGRGLEALQFITSAKYR